MISSTTISAVAKLNIPTSNRASLSLSRIYFLHTTHWKPRSLRRSIPIRMFGLMLLILSLCIIAINLLYHFFDPLNTDLVSVVSHRNFVGHVVYVNGNYSLDFDKGVRYVASP